ncbi:hypothetical protein [Sphingobium sufflavum]|uniref:hypothetical protein n=1 Tax=Sphingobium sufflavum TaxID=1129547 RepID=UPI002DD45230|nr:hypothetical protein [Sphingobium sufflavum]
MDVAATSAIERIARVLAGNQLSANAEGSEVHASLSVEMEWESHIETAIAILKTLREPDADMAAVGDVANWQRMIAAAIGEPRELADGVDVVDEIAPEHELVDRTEHDMQRKAEANANPLAPPTNNGAGS